MEYRIERKVSFIETGCIDAENEEDLKAKLKEAKIDWDVDFEYDPTIESVTAYDEEDECIELPKDIMEKDYVSGMNGCLIFNEKEFNERFFDDI